MLQDASGQCEPATKRFRSATRRRHFVSIVIGAGFFVISIGSFGADLGTGYSTAYAVSPDAAPARHRPPPARPIDPPEAKPDPSMQHTRTVDQLYDDLMRSSACLLASNNASIAGGC
jgi:hypothetical protein